MAERASYLYRLVVALPEGSEEAGWEPETWEEVCEDRGWIDPDHHSGALPPFAWPRRRLYLSPSAAEARAKLLRTYGAVVTIERSNAVTWGAVQSKPTTLTRESALATAIDWAEGRRSWVNLGSPHAGGPYTPDVIAVMDAQEVVKWSALAQALREEEVPHGR